MLRYLYDAQKKPLPVMINQPPTFAEIFISMHLRGKCKNFSALIELAECCPPPAARVEHRIAADFAQRQKDFVFSWEFVQ
jgi:hypothetical protein